MKIVKCSLACLLILAALFTSVALAKDVVMQVRVYYDTKAQWLTLHELSLDIVWKQDNYIEIMTTSKQVDELKNLGLRTEIVHTDVSAFYRSRLADKPMGDYKTLQEIYDYLDGIIAAHSDIMTARQSIGMTIEGRNIWAVKLSDNPNVDEDEPELLYTACIHAREVITPEILLNFLDYMTGNYGTDPVVTNLVNEREMWFVLVVNPDGYYRNQVTDPGGGGMWRKNRRNNGDGTYGVDLNRNFGYEWGYDDEGSSPITSEETYRGTAPFSEPETQAQKAFAEAHEFIISMYFHSYSNLVLYPWGYEPVPTPDNELFRLMADSLATFNGYDPGPSWSLYLTNGTTDDWYYGEQTTKNKSFAFTIESGTYSDGFWPEASRIPEMVDENLGACIALAEFAGNPYGILPPEPPVLSVEDTVPSTGYTVSWTHEDILNPATVFELSEYQDFQLTTEAADNMDNWSSQGFTLSTTRAASPPSSFYSGSGDDLTNYIQSNDGYTVSTGDTLRFQIYYDIESGWDYAYVEVSTDGIVFDPIDGNITTQDDPHGYNRGSGITGSSGGWVEGVFDLNLFVGQTIFMRFSYYTDGYVSEEGFYIDDIFPVGSFAIENTYFPISAMSYEFTDKTPGTYFYRVRARDTDRQYSAYSPIAQTEVVPTFICGDANGDGNINVADAVFVINYVFKGGAAPSPLAAADANGDGEENVADAVYVINYVFKGGSAPVCP